MKEAALGLFDTLSKIGRQNYEVWIYWNRKYGVGNDWRSA